LFGHHNLQGVELLEGKDLCGRIY